MKGGSSHRLKGRHLSIFLVILFLTTILLWAWEKGPAALLVAQNQLVIPSYGNDFVEDAPKESLSVDLKQQVEESNSDATNTEEVKEHVKHSIEVAKNSTTSFPADTQDSGENGSGSSKSQDFVEDAQKKSLSVDVKMEDGAVTGSGSSNSQDCNYAKGRWVEDSNQRPLYSGFGCKQWLSEMWACRLTQRTDFSFEGYRWQPRDCKMPDFNRFSFLRRMQDKTIAFIGDSLGRQQFQSMMCMATGGEESPEVENIGKVYGLVKHHGAIRPDGWAYRFPTTNTTILYYWSASLADLQPIDMTDRATDIAMHLDRAPAFMRQYLHRFDVLVLNTGHHWNRGKINGNRWVMYANGQPIVDKKLMMIGNAKNFTVHSIVKWVDSQLPLYPRLKAFFRTISPRHFLNGDWNTGGSCDNTSPLSKGSEVLADKSSDSVVEEAVRGTRVKILDITAVSELRDEGHISRYSVKATQGVNDCLHWCLPGVPDTWNELLAAQT